uniref:S-adenosyl-L-methionine-dependent methyltransferase n=1 Tax=Mycena chlorophos TaxID=658473 RepID=A0ABQ0LJA6_MYCCL|nr:S-adenosyl-L-methionine-dependent methyltransferase [Mycena chlorophos]
MPTSTIRQLLQILTEAVDTLEAACQSAAVAIPDLCDPFTPASEAFREVPKAAEAASLIGAAALQLEAIVTPPQISLYRVVSGHFKSAALRVCLESNVTELLREAGPKGMHGHDICAKNGQDPEKLARFIRYLATHHVYREVSPNVFANTRISSMLDTLKSSEEIIANPLSKHDGTFGLAALASHHLDEAFKASAYAWETLADPQTRLSGDPTASPFARAMGRPETLWTYFERPENSFAAHRFGIGMQGIEGLQPPDAILNAYPWATLPQGSRVVDVGGGVGTSCLTLAREFPGLKLVNQDLPGVIKQAGEVWNNKMPDALKSGQVVLQAHDFFTPQPQNDADVFLLKQIMHDWSDEYCVKILKRLWTAAKPDTTLLLLDSLVPLACHDPSGDSANAIPGAAPAMEAPAPLLANYGATNDMGYNADMTMFLLFNSQERTVIHFQQLLLRTGWEVVKIHRQAGDSTFLQSIEAKKIAKQAFRPKL